MPGADVYLDTIGYGCGTVLMDALWLGLPVQSFGGIKPVGRAAKSVLTAMNGERADYQLNGDYPSAVESYVWGVWVGALLVDYRSKGKPRAAMRKSPLMDAARHLRDLERSYLSAW